MKHSVRSAAAVIAASVLGGAGVAAAANDLSHQGASATTSDSAAPASPYQSAVLGTVRDLSGGADKLEQRLADARRLLAREMTLLKHQRSVSMHAASAATATAGGAVGSYVQVTAPPPPSHTTTGASGSGAPPTHTRTGASGSGSPPTHTRTGASGGSGSGSEEREHEGGDDD